MSSYVACKLCFWTVIRLGSSWVNLSKLRNIERYKKNPTHLPDCYKQQWCALVLALRCFSGPRVYLWYVLEDDRKKRVHSIASYREGDQTAVHEQNQQVKHGWRERRRKTKPEEKRGERGERNRKEKKSNLSFVLLQLDQVWHKLNNKTRLQYKGNKWIPIPKLNTSFLAASCIFIKQLHYHLVEMERIASHKQLCNVHGKPA